MESLTAILTQASRTGPSGTECRRHRRTSCSSLRELVEVYGDQIEGSVADGVDAGRRSESQEESSASTAGDTAIGHRGSAPGGGASGDPKARRKASMTRSVKVAEPPRTVPDSLAGEPYPSAGSRRERACDEDDCDGFESTKITTNSTQK